MKSVVLVRAAWCPVCPQAEELWKRLLQEHDFSYEEVDISSEKGEDLVTQHSIMSVPTTIVDGQVVFVGVPKENEAIEVISAP